MIGAARRQRWRRALLAGCAIVLAASAALAAAAPQAQQDAGGATAASRDAGLRIYREGRLPSGQPLQGVGAAQVRLQGSEAACVRCHRRSGYGSSEGSIEVRPITGSALFGVPFELAGREQASAAAGTAAASGLAGADGARAKAAALRLERMRALAGSPQRRGYALSTLARALVDGIDLDGRRMSAAMPRYALAASEIEALAAYLKTLSVRAAPGISADAIHFATVIEPGTDPAQREALLAVLRTYTRDRNLGMRNELRREGAGTVRLQRTYREWVLHVWELDGPADSWAAQLEAQLRRQPVFALLSGIGKQSWQPIHDFSERHQLPCILPQAAVPAPVDGDFYTVYLSQGLALEGQALAKYLHAEGEGGPLLQLRGTGDGAAAAAAAFGTAWQAAGGQLPRELPLSGLDDQALHRALASQGPAASLILWGSPAELARVQALMAASGPRPTIYLSATLSGSAPPINAAGNSRLRLVYPQALPAARAARVALARRWMDSKGIAPGDETVQMNAYLAATVLGMALAHGMDTYSGEFLIERLEHSLGTALEVSVYPHLSLGPGQRYASKGSYIVEAGGAGLVAVSDWIVP